MNNEEVVERLYPWIEWRRPLMVNRVSDNEARYGCRFCIAAKGLPGSGAADDRLFTSYGDWQNHMHKLHAETR